MGLSINGGTPESSLDDHIIKRVTNQLWRGGTTIEVKQNEIYQTWGARNASRTDNAVQFSAPSNLYRILHLSILYVSCNMIYELSLRVQIWWSGERSTRVVAKAILQPVAVLRKWFNHHHFFHTGNNHTWEGLTRLWNVGSSNQSTKKREIELAIISYGNVMDDLKRHELRKKPKVTQTHKLVRCVSMLPFRSGSICARSKFS